MVNLFGAMLSQWSKIFKNFNEFFLAYLNILPWIYLQVEQSNIFKNYHPNFEANLLQTKRYHDF